MEKWTTANIMYSNINVRSINTVPLGVPGLTEGEGRVLELRRFAAFGFGFVDTI